MNKLVPIITISEFDGIKDFFQQHFGFQTTFESEEFLSLCPENQTEIEFSFMKPSEHDNREFNQQGLTYCFEVEDVDAEYSRLKDKTLNILQPVQDNPWGDRSFILAAPAGIALYVYSPTEPAEEFKQYHKA